MKKSLIILLPLITVLLLNGCVTCNKPYIKVGKGCCLDTQGNGVCDNDETKPSETQIPIENVGGDWFTIPIDDNVLACTTNQDCQDYLNSESIQGSTKCEFNEAFQTTVCYLYSAAPTTPEKEKTGVGTWEWVEDVEEGFTLEEVKTLVYQTIKKYVPEAPVGGFNVKDTLSPEDDAKCVEKWLYPDDSIVDENYKMDHVLYGWITVCEKGYAGTVEDMKEYFENKYEGYSPSEVYIKTLENGKVLIWDIVSEFEAESDDGTISIAHERAYSIFFVCQDTYKFYIATFDMIEEDYYLADAYPDYKIDKNAINSIANEIMGKCKA